MKEVNLEVEIKTRVLVSRGWGRGRLDGAKLYVWFRNLEVCRSFCRGLKTLGQVPSSRISSVVVTTVGYWPPKREIGEWLGTLAYHRVPLDDFADDQLHHWRRETFTQSARVGGDKTAGVGLASTVVGKLWTGGDLKDNQIVMRSESAPIHTCLRSFVRSTTHLDVPAARSSPRDPDKGTNGRSRNFAWGIEGVSLRWRKRRQEKVASV